MLELRSIAQDLRSCVCRDIGMHDDLLEARGRLHDANQRIARRAHGEGHDLEDLEALAHPHNVLHYIHLPASMQGKASEAILRATDGFIDEAARHCFPRARHVEMQPQPGEVSQVVSPASANAHAVDYVVESEVLEDHLGDFDGEYGQWVDGFGG